MIYRSDQENALESVSEPQTGDNEPMIAEIEQSGMDAAHQPSPGQRELALKGDLDA